MSRTQRLAFLAVAAVIVVVVIVVVGTGGDDVKETGPVTVTVANGEPVGGVQKLVVKKGGTIDLTINSDVEDEVHFHGYDIHKDVDAGGSVHFELAADKEGDFEVEFEDAGLQVADVQVQP